METHTTHPNAHGVCRVVVESLCQRSPVSWLTMATVMLLSISGVMLVARQQDTVVHRILTVGSRMSRTCYTRVQGWTRSIADLPSYMPTVSILCATVYLLRATSIIPLA